MIGQELKPDEIYYIEVIQNGTLMEMSIDKNKETARLESVEDFIYPAVITIGRVFADNQETLSANGSISGLMVNNVRTLLSYIKRDLDFQNVAVEMGGEVAITEKDWKTIDEEEKLYCPDTDHFPRSEVGTEIKTDHCQQGIYRGICSENMIWLVEKCQETDGKYDEMQDREDDVFVKGLSDKYLLIYIGAGSAIALIISIIIVYVLLKRRRERMQRYEMTKNALPHPFSPSFAQQSRLAGVSTLPASLSLSESLVQCPPPGNRGSWTNIDRGVSNLDHRGTNNDILSSRIPVFGTPSQNLFPTYLAENEPAQDVISTILGERTERSYTNKLINSCTLLPTADSKLLHSSGSVAESSWPEV